MSRHYNRMAVKTSKAEAAERKAGRMLKDSSDFSKKVSGRKSMAVKVGIPQRREVDKQQRLAREARTAKLHKHFNSLLSGRAARMQGKR